MIKLNRIGLYNSEVTIQPMLDITNKIVVLEPTYLNKEYRTPENQLFIACSGFGCKVHTTGTAVYGTFISDMENTRWERTHIIGVLRNDELKNILDTAEMDDKTYDLLVSFLDDAVDKDAYKAKRLSINDRLKQHLDKIAAETSISEQAIMIRNIPVMYPVSNAIESITQTIVDNNYITEVVSYYDWVTARNKTISITDTTREYYLLQGDGNFKDLTSKDIEDIIDEIKENL